MEKKVLANKLVFNRNIKKHFNHLFNRFLLAGLIISLSSCSVYIKSIAEKDVSNKYTNLLIVIPTNPYFKNFVNHLKNDLSVEFSKSSVNSYIYVVEPQPEKLTLNDSTSIIPTSIKENKDLILYMIPRKVFILNSLIHSFTYEIVGIDHKNDKEIWKSLVQIGCQMGPTPVSKKVATIFFNQLVQDNIIMKN
jgi:hypothetical protein